MDDIWKTTSMDDIWKPASMDDIWKPANILKNIFYYILLPI